MSEGEIVKSVVEYVVSAVVLNPDEVEVNIVDEGEGAVVAEVQTAKSDLGRVIGRHGRVARTIRTLARTAGEEEGLHTGVEFIE